MEKSSVFDLFLSLAEKHNVLPIAKNLISTVKGSTYVPSRIRVYTSQQQFNYALTATSKDWSVDVNEDKTSFVVDMNGTFYVYALVESNAHAECGNYNSVFLGINYKSTSFNKFKVVEHGVINDIEYFIYIDSKSPKCLRFGIVGSWSGKDLDVFKRTECSSFFN